jgi:hypothetical protein
MSKRILATLLVLLSWALLACSEESSSDVPPPVAGTRQELLCSQMCNRGEACGLLNECMSVDQCCDGCLHEYALVETPSACLDAIEAFQDCFWRDLACAELTTCESMPGCDAELDAIRAPCDVTGTGFDKDRYVFVPLFCLCGVG